MGIYNINFYFIEDVVGFWIKVIFIFYIVGNFCNMEIIMDVVKCYNLWVLEDSCDVLGVIFDGILVGIFG